MSSAGIEIRTRTALGIHALCGVSLFSAFLLARELYNWTLLSHPAQTLLILTIVYAPMVIASYSSLRRDPQYCSYLKAVGRGLLGLPIGALLNAFGAVVLGAPVGIKFLTRTINWSLLMSLFNFVPAACVFGSSAADWQHILDCTKWTSADYVISVPAYGAVLGAWFGAWPMPLDWERPWQEWPICVTYGTISGFLLGMLVSSVLILMVRREAHVKDD